MFNLIVVANAGYPVEGDVPSQLTSPIVFLGAVSIQVGEIVMAKV